MTGIGQKCERSRDKPSYDLRRHIDYHQDQRSRQASPVRETPLASSGVMVMVMVMRRPLCHFFTSGSLNSPGRGIL